MRVARRGWAVAAIAVLFYFFANQTQVGWLYVFSALAAGLWLTTLFLPGRTVRRLAAARRGNGAENAAALELHAGQPVTLEVSFQNTPRLPPRLRRGHWLCTLAPRPARTPVL